MAYDAKAVANYFLDLAKEQNTALTPMKLQKLVFFAHGWNLALYKEPLIANAVEAWQFGPVIPSLYHEFKNVGSGTIESKATRFDLENFEIVAPTVPESDSKARALLQRIWVTYSKLSAMQLSNLTHLPDSPWAKARAGKEGQKNVVIDDSVIQHYFGELAEKNRAVSGAT